MKDRARTGSQLPSRFTSGKTLASAELNRRRHVVTFRLLAAASDGELKLMRPQVSARKRWQRFEWFFPPND
ncbi:MAG: hypothetical protein ACTS6G_03880 [Candidatus Hodgkinia cicadicola]